MNFRVLYLACALTSGFAGGAPPAEELAPSLMELEKSFKADVVKASNIVDLTDWQRMLRGPFGSSHYDPRENHWFVAEMLTSMGSALREPPSSRRDRMIWAGMAATLKLVESYCVNLDQEGTVEEADRKVFELQRVALRSNGLRAISKLAKLLVQHTSLLNPAYFDEKRSDFEELTARFEAGDERVGRGTFFLLADAKHGWDSHSIAYEALEEVTTDASPQRPELRRLGLFLLVAMIDSRVPEERIRSFETYFAGVLMNDQSDLKERAVASYGLALLSKADDEYLRITNQILNAMLPMGEQFQPYCDTCRRALNAMAAARFRQNSDHQGTLAGLLEVFNPKKNGLLEYFHFLMVPEIHNACIEAILIAAPKKTKS